MAWEIKKKKLGKVNGAATSAIKYSRLDLNYCDTVISSQFERHLIRREAQVITLTQQLLLFGW